MLGAVYHAFIDSDYRISGESGNFTYPITLPKNAVCDSVAVLQGSFPKSYYLVRSQRNTLTLTEGAMSATITVPVGNYNINSFRAVLTALLTAGSPNGWVYAMSQPNTATSASTGKYTFTVTGNGGVQPAITFPTTSLIYQQCGFAYNSTNTFVANSLTSIYVVNFNSAIGMVVKSDLIDNTSGDLKHGGAVLQEVYNFNTSDFSNVSFQNSNVLFTAKRLKSGGLPESANFSIHDTDDIQLDFNGGSCNFSLVFFQKDNYHEVAMTDVKMRWYEDIIGGNKQVIGEKKEQPTAAPAPAPTADPTTADTSTEPDPRAAVAAAQASAAATPDEPAKYVVASRQLNITKVNL